MEAANEYSKFRRLYADLSKLSHNFVKGKILFLLVSVICLLLVLTPNFACN